MSRLKSFPKPARWEIYFSSADGKTWYVGDVIAENHPIALFEAGKRFPYLFKGRKSHEIMKAVKRKFV
jgi:hypothetical protein